MFSKTFKIPAYTSCDLTFLLSQRSIKISSIEIDRITLDEPHCLNEEDPVIFSGINCHRLNGLTQANVLSPTELGVAGEAIASPTGVVVIPANLTGRAISFEVFGDIPSTQDIEIISAANATGIFGESFIELSGSKGTKFPLIKGDRFSVSGHIIASEVIATAEIIQEGCQYYEERVSASQRISLGSPLTSSFSDQKWSAVRTISTKESGQLPNITTDVNAVYGLIDVALPAINDLGTYQYVLKIDEKVIGKGTLEVNV